MAATPRYGPTPKSSGAGPSGARRKAEPFHPQSRQNALTTRLAAVGVVAVAVLLAAATFRLQGHILAFHWIDYDCGRISVTYDGRPPHPMKTGSAKG
jgi:hypothetical protein